MYYQVSQRYEYYVPLRAIFADEKVAALESSDEAQDSTWKDDLRQLQGAKIVLLSGVFVDGSRSGVDLLIAGDVRPAQLKKVIKGIESFEGRELNYTYMTYEDFYYRLSVRDRFVNEIIGSKYQLLVDKENILKALD